MRSDAPPPRPAPLDAPLARLAITAALLLACAGCATSASSRGRAGDEGLTVELLMEDDAGRSALYRVEPDGTLRFAGGRDAHRASFTWSGPMTDDETGRLRNMIDAHGWLDADPPSTGEPPGASYTITLRGPRGRRSFTVLGSPPDVAEVHALLQSAARRRHENFLRSLPEAGAHRP